MHVADDLGEGREGKVGVEPDLKLFGRDGQKKGKVQGVGADVGFCTVLGHELLQGRDLRLRCLGPLTRDTKSVTYREKPRLGPIGLRRNNLPVDPVPGLLCILKDDPRDLLRVTQELHRCVIIDTSAIRRLQSRLLGLGLYASESNESVRPELLPGAHGSNRFNRTGLQQVIGRLGRQQKIHRICEHSESGLAGAGELLANQFGAAQNAAEDERGRHCL